MTKTFDDDLVKRCQQELPYVTTAFEQLLRKYEPLVYRRCRRYLGGAEEAEEASQDVFLRVFNALEKFEGGSNFSTWLFRIASNVCASRYARLKKIERQKAAYAQETRYVSAKPPRGSAAAAERGVELVDVLKQLSGSDQHILSLRYLSGLSTESIAQDLGIGLSAAKMRIRRARHRFREAYRKHGR